MSTDFRLERIEPSARDVRCQQFFGALNPARFESCSLLLFFLTPAILSRPESKKYKYLFSRQLYKLQAKICGHVVCCKHQLIGYAVGSVGARYKNAHTEINTQYFKIHAQEYAHLWATTVRMQSFFQTSSKALKRSRF